MITFSNEMNVYNSYYSFITKKIDYLYKIINTCACSFNIFYSYLLYIKLNFSIGIVKNCICLVEINQNVAYSYIGRRITGIISVKV